MKPIDLKMKCALALVIGGMLAAGPVLAEKPAWAGGGKGDKDQSTERRNVQKGEQKGEKRGEQKSERRQGAAKSSRRDSPAIEKGSHFQDQHRVVVREYYTEQFSKGRCPPGLAKKNNGCMPPGQAKKWRLGYPLPSDVIYYSVPQPLVLQIGAPPPGYRYVRVANDILMIAIGTGMIVDAIQNLGL